mgnify:CR=1 FL=1|jgi:D-sedoheptulose 7-phosphate isomerase
MNLNNFIPDYFDLIDKKIKSVNLKELENVIRLIKEVRDNKCKVIVIGNGGSASIASHMSIDLTKSVNIRTINFNESSLLTCFSNDYGYDYWAEKALEFYADKQDLAILISSSGQSKNIINGAIKAKEMGLSVVTLSGFMNNNPLKEIGDVNLWVDSESYNIIETTHQTWLLSVVDYLIKHGDN